MSDPSASGPDANGVHRTRLFAGICLALVPTGASFALLGNVLGQLKEEFILTNAHVGFIAGAGISGMAISLLVLGPLLEGFGMKKGTAAAFVGHVTGLVLMIAAAPLAGTPAGFWMLTLGAVVLAMGHGMIEVAGNPLAAALYPEDKTTKLNWFHAFFPIGILAGSLIGFGLNHLGGPLFHWTFQLGIILIPVIIYGVMVLPQKFPPTENTAAGLPVADMFRNTFTSPLMYLMLLMMAVAVSIELGAGRWIPEVFARVDVPGILLLSWISLIMVVLRLNAAYFVEKFTPPGLLTFGGASMALGMFLFGIAQGTPAAFLGATFFGLGVAFFFPTIVGIVSERLPHTGSLGIVLTCGFGLLVAGQVGTVGIGWIGDRELASYLNADERRAGTVALLEDVSATFPEFQQQADEAENPLEEHGFLPEDLAGAIALTNSALAEYRERGDQIVGDETPQALRAIYGAVPGAGDRIFAAAHPEAEDLPRQEAAELRKAFDERIAQLVADAEPAAILAFAEESPAHRAVLAGAVLNPAEGYGGQRALLMIAWIPLILFVVFGVMLIGDKKKGGYKAVRLQDAMGAGAGPEVPHEGSVPPEYAEELAVTHGGEGEGDAGQTPDETPKA